MRILYFSVLFKPESRVAIQLQAYLATNTGNWSWSYRSFPCPPPPPTTNQTSNSWPGRGKETDRVWGPPDTPSHPLSTLKGVTAWPLIWRECPLSQKKKKFNCRHSSLSDLYSHALTAKVWKCYLCLLSTVRGRSKRRPVDSRSERVIFDCRLVKVNHCKQLWMI